MAKALVVTSDMSEAERLLARLDGVMAAVFVDPGGPRVHFVCRDMQTAEKVLTVLKNQFPLKKNELQSGTFPIVITDSGGPILQTTSKYFLLSDN